MRRTFANLIFTILPFSVSEIEEAMLFKSGEEGYSNYRIPALITMKCGFLLAI